MISAKIAGASVWRRTANGAGLAPQSARSATAPPATSARWTSWASARDSWSLTAIPARRTAALNSATENGLPALPARASARAAGSASTPK